MNSYIPSAADFEPLQEARDAERIDRPSLSYWQDVWRRLKKNSRAIISLYLVIGLLLFTLVGPLLWQVDPALQDLEQISQPPNLGRSALVIADGAPRQEITSRQITTRVASGSERPAQNLRILGTPHSEGVTIAWDAVPGASAYQLYRHELEPSSIDDLGLPLQRLRASQLSYLDRLGLETRPYYYSLVAVFGEQESRLYSSLPVEIEQAILASEAVYRGLLQEGEAAAAVGTQINLESHPLGTDYLGRDMLARLMWGARTSLFIGILAPLFYVSIGLIYGGLAGYSGGRMDNLMMRFADFVIALPFLLFMILFKIAFGLGAGESGIGPMLLALVLLSWPATARLVRGQVLQIREEAYIAAARLMGASAPYLVMRHMLPNVMGVLLVSLTFAIPTAIFIEAFLSFIGMGVVPPTPSWGSMCNDGLRTMLSHPHELMFPAFFISITVLTFNLLGDGLRDAMDARMRSGT
jgi:oligopeptide transport system permease protein